MKKDGVLEQDIKKLKEKHKSFIDYINTELLVVWDKKYDVAGDDWGVKALQCRDGGYITGGNVGTGAGVRARLIKRNKLGEANLK